jgi:MFS family permease
MTGMAALPTVLETSIVNVAISRIQGEFGGSTTDVQWISTAYTLALGVVVPTSAWLGDRFGLQRVYVLALVGFTIGSALCGVASSLDTLIAFRVFQAIGGGLLPVLAQTMIYRVVPRERIGSAIGLYGLGIIVAPAVGPTLGGWLVEDVNWRLIFYINVPVGVVATILSLTILPRFARGPARRFDLPGFVFIGGGLACLLIAFSEGTNWGWTSYSVLLLVAGGALCLAVFVVVVMHVITPEISRTPIIVANCIRNGGIGLALIPVITGATAGLPTARTGQASAILNVVQRMAPALGLAALTALLTGHEAQQSLSQASLLPATVPGFPQLTAIAAHGQGAILGLDGTVQNQAFGGSLDDVFLLTAGLSAIGVLLALLLPTGSSLARARKRAASTGSEPAGVIHLRAVQADEDGSMAGRGARGRQVPHEAHR